jgi:hypothetical protein
MTRAFSTVLVGAALFAVGAAGATGRQQLRIYAGASQAQFVDHSDDRARGAVQNPFNVDVDALLPVSKAMQKGGGPYPGDSATYSFKLYSDAGLKKKLGTAVYSCTFNFNKRALCSADFELTGGTMFAYGLADFTSPRFILAVNGGTGKYLGAHGQVSSAPAVKDAHRLDFVLLR